MDSRPANSAELLPKRLYVAEVLMLPLFWLAPMLLLVLGGTMASDAGKLNERYDIEFSDSRYLMYLVTFTLGHLGSGMYRVYRRNQILEEIGLSAAAASRQLNDYENYTNRVFGLWFLVQFIVLAGAFLAPESTLGTLAFLYLLANVVIGPLVVWFDLRRVRSTNHVSWGWTRILHIAAAAVPLTFIYYIIQRDDHFHYALAIDVWDTDPEELAVAADEKTKAEKFADRFSIF